jgi:hypothetical protein
MKCCLERPARERSAQQRLGDAQPAAVRGQAAEEKKRFGVLGILGKQLAQQRFCFAQLPGAVASGRLREKLAPGVEQAVRLYRCVLRRSRAEVFPANRAVRTPFSSRRSRPFAVQAYPSLAFDLKK